MNPLSPEAVREVARLAASKWWEHLGPQNTAPDAVADAVAVHLLAALARELRADQDPEAAPGTYSAIRAALKEFEK